MAKRILIADDSVLMRKQIRAILKSDKDIEICAEAAEGSEAVRKTRECLPDLAVLDFLMPGVNGLEATREMKRLMRTLPVLLFTIDDSPHLEWESKQAGADAVLAKAEGSRQLSQVLHSLLQ
jgi:DNA-binding NarL/FixJ family response regulator